MESWSTFIFKSVHWMEKSNMTVLLRFSFSVSQKKSEEFGVM